MHKKQSKIKTVRGETMQYRIDPKSGNKLSVLGYGCMRFTKKGMSINVEKAETEMKYAIDLGVNYFDIAYICTNLKSIIR